MPGLPEIIDGTLVFPAIEGFGSLTLFHRDPPDIEQRIDFGYVTVTFRHAHVTATSMVELGIPARQPLSAFFDEIAATYPHRSTWDTWESYEGTMRLSAHHDGKGHIYFKVELGSPWGSWHGGGTFMIEAGQIENAARLLKRFLGNGG